MEVHMHIAIARFPAVPAERDNDFRDWFAWSNDQLRGTEGLMARRLLRAPDGSYTALVEHEDATTFAAMHTKNSVTVIQEGLRQILTDAPQATSYDVVVDSSTAKKCCGGHGADSHEGATPAHGSGGCCQA